MFYDYFIGSFIIRMNYLVIRYIKVNLNCDIGQVYSTVNTNQLFSTSSASHVGQFGQVCLQSS